MCLEKRPTPKPPLQAGGHWFEPSGMSALEEPDADPRDERGREPEAAERPETAEVPRGHRRPTLRDPTHAGGDSTQPLKTSG